MFYVDRGRGASGSITAAWTRSEGYSGRWRDAALSLPQQPTAQGHVEEGRNFGTYDTWDDEWMITWR